MKKLKVIWTKFSGNPRLFIPCFALVLFSVSFKSRLNDTNWRYVFNSDGKGYYAFLPAAFIYSDLSFPFVEEYEANYYDAGNFSEFRMGAGDHIVNKYWSGVSVMMSPWFFSGMLWARLAGYECDGYDYPFQASIAFGAICWLLLAVYLLFEILVKSYRFSNSIALISVICIVFGTNLFYYTVFEPSMSHVYSFTAITAWIWTFFRFRGKPAISVAVLFGALLGLIGLIRPTNLIVLLALPFLCGGLHSFKEFVSSVIQSPRQFLSMAIAFLLIIGIQPVIFLIQTGSPWAYTYGKEGFQFLQPEIINFLFSFRKGLFIYTPLTFLALSGFFFMNRTQGTWLSIFLALVVYLLSSWWMWFYGGSYGMRAAIDFFPFFAILLGFAIRGFPVLVLSLCVFCLLYSGVQTYQYSHWILPYDGMNREKFMMIFMRTGDEYIGKLKAE